MLPVLSKALATLADYRCCVDGDVFCVARAVKGLGDSDSDDDSAAAWVRKNRKLSKEKQLAEKRVGFIVTLLCDVCVCVCV